MRFPPAIVQLRRAQLILMLAVLVPTILMTALGIVLLAVGTSSVTVFAGVLVLAFTTTAVTGYILGTIFVSRGTSLARVQNDFFSSVSHELRTPLTSIHLLLELLAGDRLERGERDHVIELLTREVTRLDRLLVRTLDLSKLQTGRHAFEMLPMSADDLANEAVAAFDAATLTRPTTIALDIEPELTVVGDRATLVRAVVNLLINAWKYTGDDKRITLRIHGHLRRVVIAVEDNGPGIDPVEKSTVFEGFTRGRNARTQRAPGVGLGLTIVRAIVRAHRGKVAVESEPGKGATFRIELPRRRAAATDSDTAAVPSPAGGRP